MSGNIIVGYTGTGPGGTFNLVWNSVDSRWEFDDPIYGVAYGYVGDTDPAQFYGVGFPYPVYIANVTSGPCPTPTPTPTVTPTSVTPTPTPTSVTPTPTPSVGSSCDYTVEVYSGVDNNYFSFVVTNNSPSSTLTVTAFNGLGFVSLPSLPAVIAAGDDPRVFDVDDAQLEMAESFTITTAECGESPEYPTPPAI